MTNESSKTLLIKVLLLRRIKKSASVGTPVQPRNCNLVYDQVEKSTKIHNRTITSEYLENNVIRKRWNIFVNLQCRKYQYIIIKAIIINYSKVNIMQNIYICAKVCV